MFSNVKEYAPEVYVGLLDARVIVGCHLRDAAYEVTRCCNTESRRGAPLVPPAMMFMTDAFAGPVMPRDVRNAEYFTTLVLMYFTVSYYIPVFVYVSRVYTTTGGAFIGVS